MRRVSLLGLLVHASRHISDALALHDTAMNGIELRMPFNSTRAHARSVFFLVWTSMAFRMAVCDKKGRRAGDRIACIK